MVESEEFYKQLEIELDEWRKTDQYKKLITEFPNIVKNKQNREFIDSIINVHVDSFEDYYLSFSCPLYLSDRMIYNLKKHDIRFISKMNKDKMYFYIVFDKILSYLNKANIIRSLSQEFKVELEIEDKPLIYKYDSRNVGDHWLNHFQSPEYFLSKEYLETVPRFEDSYVFPTMCLTINKEDSKTIYKIDKSFGKINIEEEWQYDRN